MAIRIAKSEITALTCRKMKHLKIIDFLYYIDTDEIPGFFQ